VVLVLIIGYLIVAIVVSVIFTVAMTTMLAIGQEPERADWMVGGLFGLMAGMLWPLTLLVWGIGMSARKLYNVSKESSNAQ
jgi:uncharacterized membrane protein